MAKDPSPATNIQENRPAPAAQRSRAPATAPTPPSQANRWEVWAPAAFLIVLGVLAAVLTLFVSLRLLAVLVAGFGLIFALAVRRFAVSKNNPAAVRFRLINGGLALNAIVGIVAASLAFFGPRPPRSVDKLFQALKSPSAESRRDAALQLGKKGDTVALAELMTALEDPEPSVRAAAATALGEIGPRARLAHFNLLQASADPDAATAAAARASLQQVGIPGANDIELLLAEASNSVRAACAVGLWQLALHSHKADVRREAALTIGKKGPAAGAALADLLEALEDRDPAVRSAAATALGDLGPKARLAYFDLLLAGADADEAFIKAAQEAAKQISRPSPADVDDFQAALAHPSPRLRSAAAKGLWLIGPASKKASAALENTLQDDDVWVRLWSAQALCTLKHEPAKVLPVLKQAIPHADPKVRKMAVHVLQEMRASPDDALAALLTQLGRERDPTIAVPIIETIAAMGEAAGKASPALRRALERQNKNDVPIRRAAALALAQVRDGSKEVLDALTAALGDPDAGVCGQAVLSLASFGPAARATCLEPLRGALEHGDQRVRGLAVDALGQIDARDDKTIEALRQVLQKAHARDEQDNKSKKTEKGEQGGKSKKTEKEVLEAMIASEICFKTCMVFAAFGPVSRPAVPDLRKVLGHSQPKVRAGAVYALYQIGIEGKDRGETINALIAVLAADADDDVCLQAIGAVQSCGPDGKDAVAPLIRILDGRSPVLRAAAATALGKIGAEARSAIPALIDALDDPIYDVRLQTATVFTLGPFRTEARTAPRRSLAPSTVGVLAAATGPLLATASLMPENYGAGAALCNVLRDTNPNLRLIATYALGNIMDEAPTTAESLARLLLEDRDIRVRAGAAAALHAIRPKNSKVVSALCLALVQDTKSRDVRLSAALALGAIADRAALPALEAALKDDADADVKAAAEQALKVLKNR